MPGPDGPGEAAGRGRIGCQLWVEQDDSAVRVDALCARARECGLGLLRVFVIWPWVQPTPQQWDFRLYDAVFDAADRHGLRIKATLSPENAPWHRGTPGLVQAAHLSLPSEGEARAAIADYVSRVVRRYREHPALCQWILWNEPVNGARDPRQPGPLRTDAQRARWHDQLRDHFGDVAALNRAWRTGYDRWSDVPFAEDVVHPAHRGLPFAAFGPWLADTRLRSAALVEELRFVHDTIRADDPDTPTCINPADLFANQARGGYDLAALASVSTVLGASVHPPWHLGFAERDRHPALIAATVRLLARCAARVELTEVQSGTVYYGSPHPAGMSPGHLVGCYLAALAAGAESSTGWCLNVRSDGFEAGDWSLLDDDDRCGARSAALGELAGLLQRIEDRIGPWRVEPARALVLMDHRSEAVQLVHSWTGRELPGRAPDDAPQGAALLCATLAEAGLAAAPAPVDRLAVDREPDAEVLIASQLTAWTPATAELLLRWAQAGATVVLDGTSGHKDLDGVLHRRWPGGLPDRIGLRAVDMDTDEAGFALRVHGAPAGRAVLVCTDVHITDPAWRPVSEITRADGAPVVWWRPWGEGRLVWSAVALGPSLVHGAAEPVVRALLDRFGPRPAVRPLSPATIAPTVHGERGEAVVVIGPDGPARGGTPLRVAVPPGNYTELWLGQSVRVGPGGHAVLPAADGVAVLVADAG